MKHENARRMFGVGLVFAPSLNDPFAMVLTFRYRIKDASSGRHLQRQARAVSRVWSYCGEIQEAARRHNKRWPSGFDLIKLTLGSSKLLALHSDTVQAVWRGEDVKCGSKCLETRAIVSMAIQRKPGSSAFITHPGSLRTMRSSR